ncbi:cell envelope integrity protein TolA [Hyphobacterium marinum]|uniref:Cell envelope integrity protein TolA n=1 Tax=Hyphobacterium marinum TaxID=3116574 RepID=A0ABU7LXW9_9PROT|nr:cell envelope integrity protein TolA [Hyphobacterium sp. Y6023]MEE2566408.1 cell envelope integrity protein TolA [Hyphobacterium sp. Y6023]
MIYLPQAARQFSAGVIVPVDLVTLADTTNVRAAAPDPVVEEIPPEPEPAVEEEADAVADPPAATSPPVEEERPVEVIDDGAPDEAEPEPEVVEETPTPPTPRERPEQPRQQQTERQQEQASVDLDYLSGLVDQARESQPRDRGNAETGERREGAGAGTAMTATLADLVISQAQPCFRSSIDAPNPERLNVTVRVRLNRDGSLAEPPVSTNSGRIRASGDPFWLVAEERALAAIIDCSPFRLPADQYSQWRLIDVTFHNDIF